MCGAISSLDEPGIYVAAYRLESHSSTPARARDGRASVGVSMEHGANVPLVAVAHTV